MRGPAKIATYVATVMVLAGFVTIFLAWNGAAELDFPTGQFPYLMSGGLVGLGLIIGGMGIMYVQTSRQLTAERTQQMQRLNATMARTVELARAVEVVPAAPAEDRAATPAGAPEDAGAADGAVPGTVVAGRSSFHDPACHLVASRDDLDALTRDEADAAGFGPCRICKP